MAREVFVSCATFLRSELANRTINGVDQCGRHQYCLRLLQKAEAKYGPILNIPAPHLSLNLKMLEGWGEDISRVSGSFELSTFKPVPQSLTCSQLGHCSLL